MLRPQRINLIVPKTLFVPKNVVSPENVVEADRQQATVEHEPTSTRQLRDRSMMVPPDRYGVPVALLADVYEVTYMTKLWHF